VALNFTGGCMCGEIRYECSAEPIAMGLCHCRDCQRATGSAFAAALMVPRSTVTITGDVKYYEVIGDSGNPIRRGFCANCGSRLFGSRANADFLSIQAGSLATRREAPRSTEGERRDDSRAC
jgi:hypothetical protein